MKTFFYFSTCENILFALYLNFFTRDVKTEALITCFLERSVVPARCALGVGLTD